MSKAATGIAVAALIVSLVALGGFGYTYTMVTQAIHNAQNNNTNGNQQTTGTSNGNSQNNSGCTSNCNSQTNGGCTSNCGPQTSGSCTSNCNSQTNGGCASNCTGGGTNVVVTVTSGTTTTLDQCQGTSNGQTQTYSSPANNNDQCLLTGNQVLVFTFVAGASGLSATGSFQSQSNIDVKFTDVTASQTLNSQTATTGSSFTDQLTNGHTYVVQITNDGAQNNALTLSFSITG